MKSHLPIILSSLALGAVLSALEPGNFLLGWLIFSFLFLLSFYVLRFSHRWSTGGRSLAWAMALAFLLRLALGVILTIALPVDGNPSEHHQAGYVFFDSYRRDAQAWELAQSDAPILSAFNKNYYTDQYGGLLALSATAYRYLSPDAHRPLLPSLLGAMMATLGLAFLWRTAVQQWGDQVALAAVWIYALYPESILLGSSQMREPFLMAFMAMALWGFVSRGADWKSAIPWLSIGFLGMLLLSPAVALLTLVLFAGWTFVQREHGRVSWVALLTTGLVFIAGLYLLAWGLEREQPFGSSPVGIVMNFARDAVKWDTYQLERGSGWIQKLFSEMPEGLHPLFVMIYGLTQPVLPAAFVEPTTLILRLLGIFRALGWYALVPLLFYAPFAATRSRLALSGATDERVNAEGVVTRLGSAVEGSGEKRRLWYWLIALVWIWSIVAALRGGADQWDNPRYRAILIVVESLVAGFAWVNRDRWLKRWIILEVVFLAFFTYWYAHRYYHIGVEIGFGLMVALIFIFAVIILGGGWWLDKRRVRRT